MALRQAPLRKSLTRKATILGAERTPTLMLLTVCGLLIFSGMTILTFIMGIAILTGGMWALRLIAKQHPQMTVVYRRFVKYRKYYPARKVHDAPMPHREAIEIARGKFG